MAEDNSTRNRNPHGHGPKPTTLDDLAERFWVLVILASPDECWLWRKSSFRGSITPATGMPRMKATRVAWYLTHGQWAPSDLFVCHECDNPRCVNPAHLWLGTQKENIADAKRKGRLKTPFVPGTRIGEAYWYKAGRIVSEEDKARTSRVHRGAKRTAEQRARMSVAQKAVVRKPRQRDANSGRFIPETKERVAISRTLLTSASKSQTSTR